MFSISTWLAPFTLLALGASGVPENERPTMMLRPISVEQERLVAVAVAEKEVKWRELAPARPAPGVKVWRPLAARTEKVGYEPTEDVSLTVATYADDSEARLEMQKRRDTIPRPRLGPLQGLGDEAEAWTGFAIPGLTAIHCRSGRVVFSLFAPSRDIGERFAKAVADALRAPTRPAD